MAASAKIDRFYLFSTMALTLGGFIIFLSASLGLLTQNGASFEHVAIKQFVNLLIGLTLFIVLSRIKHTFFRKIATIILIAAIGMNLLLFIPGITLSHNGAARWINFGLFSFQPSEFLKIASIIYFAAWINHVKEKVLRFRYGLFPYFIIMSILGALLLFQSDTDTLVVIGLTGLSMLMVSGMPIRHIGLVFVGFIVLITLVITQRPYATERFRTYLDPTSNVQTSGYQINQSLIAIGSGGFMGRGFGQSVQKFGYLPQPTDDSIFAVAIEEFGFVGGMLLLGLYCLFATSALRVATRCTDLFGSMIAVGLAVLVIAESFLNISAMLGLVPVSGLPLLFVSQGGTALIVTLAAAGIVANISKYTKITA